MQPVCPQLQTISVLSAIPSQWALQYFDFSSAIQLQAAFAHFLGVALAIILLYRNARAEPGRVAGCAVRCRMGGIGWSGWASKVRFFADPGLIRAADETGSTRDQRIAHYFPMGFRAK